MPRLREAVIPFGHHLFRNLLKLANAIVILFGIFTVVLSFEINPTPKFSPGWLLIFLGATTMLGGLTGFGGTTLPCCYKSHIILMSIAILGTAVFCLVMFGQRSKVVASFKSARFSEATVDHYLSEVSWAYVFIVLVESVALLARVFYQRLAAPEHFETIAQTQDFRNVAMGKMRQEIEGHSNRVDQTRAANLDNKIKDKYAKSTMQCLSEQCAERSEEMQRPLVALEALNCSQV